MAETGTNEFTLAQLPRRKERVGNPPGRRAWLPAMLRGMRGACPACGEGRLFVHGLRVTDACDRCGEELYHHRADRKGVALAAFVALQIVLLLVAALQLAGVHWSPWVWIVPWVLTFAMLMRPAKGAVVGLQWALRLHGFQYAAMCRPRRK